MSLDNRINVAHASQPVRIRSLDFLRGLAILGMLVANIPWHAGDSMSRVSEPDAASVTAWLMQYLIFDQRFMPILAMLFGASVLLLLSRHDDPSRLRGRTCWACSSCSN